MASKQRNLAADGRESSERRCARTSSRCRPRRTRPSTAGRSAASSTCDQVRDNNRMAGSSCSIATTHSTPTTSSTTGRPRQDGFKQNQCGGTIGGPVFKDKTFFSATIRGTGRPLADVPLDGSVDGNAQGQFLGADEPHLRSDHGQPFPGNTIPGRPHRHRRAQHPDAALPRAESAGTRQASNGQTIKNYLIQSLKQRSTTVRRQGRSQPVDQHRFLRATVSRRRIGCSRLARARRCRLYFGAGDGTHQGPEPGVQRYADARLNWLNEFRFGWSSHQVQHDPRSTTSPILRTRSAYPGSTSTTRRQR